MKARCSPGKWLDRVDLAARYRVVTIYGMFDMMVNHMSANPGDTNRTPPATPHSKFMTSGVAKSLTGSGDRIFFAGVYPVGMVIASQWLTKEIPPCVRAACEPEPGGLLLHAAIFSLQPTHMHPDLRQFLTCF